LVILSPAGGGINSAKDLSFWLRIPPGRIFQPSMITPPGNPLETKGWLWYGRIEVTGCSPEWEKDLSDLF
jgi:hypothetical protein